MRTGHVAGKVGIGLAVLILAVSAHIGAAFAAPLPAIELESMSLEDLMNIPVYAASRFEQKSSEAPSSVTVVTSREIRKYGWKTLADLLRTVRGFHVSYDRSYNWVGVRGFLPPGDSNTKILTLVDGHRMNDDVYNQAYLGEDFLLDLDLVDRVEIVRGPGSSLYGSNAFFAVINVITRRGESVKGGEASLEGEHPRGLRGRLTYGNRFKNGAEVLLSVSALDRPGEDLFFPEFNDPATNNGVAQGLDGVRNRRFFGSASLGAFTLTGGYVRRDKDIPTSSFGAVFPDPTGWYLDESYFTEARYEKEHDGTSVQARLFRDWHKFDSKMTMEDPMMNPIAPFRLVMRDRAEARSWGAETKVTRTLLERHTATAGAEYRRIYRITQTIFAEDPFTSFLDTNRNSYVWALFLQDEVRLAEGLLLNVGIRHDHYGTFGGTTNPRAALIWSPRETTALKLLYGQAFRAPTPFELYWNDGGLTQKASPDLKPERIRTLEVVWEQGLGKNLRSVVAAYENRIKDPIGVVTDPADSLDVSRNLGEARGMGGRGGAGREVG